MKRKTRKKNIKSKKRKINMVTDKMIDVALQVVQAATIPIKDHFRMNRDTHSSKDAKSAIVTAADIEAETVMRELIRHNFPDHSIEGEELGKETGNSEYRWILDPIDGTSNFAMGKPIFGTLVALFKGNVPVIGIIHQPILNETFLGVAGRPTLMNGKEIRTSDLDSFSNALMATNPPYMYENEKEKRVLWGLHGDARSTEFGGDCYNYAMLAAGHIDIALVSGDDFHDFAAVIPIVEGAGGIITDWEGNPLTPLSSGHIIATAGPRFHEQVLKRIAHHAIPPTPAVNAFEKSSLSL